MKSYLRLSLAALAIVIIAVVALRWVRYSSPTVVQPTPVPTTGSEAPVAATPKPQATPLPKLSGLPVDAAASGGARWVSEVHVQNVGNEPTQISLTLYPANGGPEQQTKAKTAAAGAAVIFRAGQDLPSGFSGSAVVNSTSQAVRAVVLWQDANGRARSTYAASPPSQGRIDLPLVKRAWQDSDTTLFVQNAGSEPTKVRIQFVPAGDGQPQTFEDDTPLAPGRSRAYTAPESLGSFLGSAIISANPPAPLAVSYRELAKNGRMYSGAGLDPGWQGTELSAPVVRKQWLGSSSTIYVQNAGEKPAKVSVTYKSYDTGKEYTSSIGSGKTIAPGAARAYAADPVLPGDPKGRAGFRGSAVITSDQPVAVLILEETTGGSNGLAYAGVPKEAASNQAVVPLVRAYWMGSETGIAVTNVGTAPTKVGIRYKSSITGKEYPGPWGTGELLAAGASRSYYLEPPMPDSIDGSGFIGAATITADQPIVVTYDEMFAEEDRDTIGGNGQNIYP
ncbi:MAG: hypothetical protein HY677_05755 [Chloroflexi bacterium]|nr:hypothetical protein [Chloroflexota bacterium]